MYFKEYILPLWHFSFSIIFLLFSIYYFLYRILVARKFQYKKRIEERNFIYLYFFIIGLMQIIISLQNRNNINISSAIVFIGVGFCLYDYNLILNEGLFIKGRFISWNKISKLDYKKNNKEIVLSYFKNNNHSQISKVTFIIGYDSNLTLENMLKDKVNNTNINNVDNEDKIYSVKRIKIGLSLVLISLTMIFVYGIYSLLQPRVLGDVLEKTFNHRDTSSVAVRYEGELKDKGAHFDISMTSKEEKIKEIKNYLNSLHIRKIQFQDLKYRRLTTEYLYSITFYELDGDKVEIFMSKKEPIIEIVRNNKRRSYFIEKGYEDSEFLNKLGKSLE